MKTLQITKKLNYSPIYLKKDFFKGFSSIIRYYPMNQLTIVSQLPVVRSEHVRYPKSTSSFMKQCPLEHIYTLELPDVEMNVKTLYL